MIVGAQLLSSLARPFSFLGRQIGRAPPPTRVSGRPTQLLRNHKKWGAAYRQTTPTTPIVKRRHKNCVGERGGQTTRHNRVKEKLHPHMKTVGETALPTEECGRNLQAQKSFGASRNTIQVPVSCRAAPFGKASPFCLAELRRRAKPRLFYVVPLWAMCRRNLPSAGQ